MLAGIVPLLLGAGLRISAAPALDVRSEIKRAERFGKDAASLVLRRDILPYRVAGASQLVYRAKPDG